MSRIAIAIQSCVPYRDRRDAIRGTWLEDVPPGIDTYFFVGGDGLSAEEADLIDREAEALPCGDSYEDCAKKQIEMIRAVRDYDHVFFCDDDTYVVPDRLLASGFEKYDYVGCPCDVHEWKIVMAHGGAGFWMSRPAMASALLVPFSNQTTFSDRAVGYLMHEAGYKLWGDFRYNLGKYNGDKGYCNLVPTPKNRYVTTHFVQPHMHRIIRMGFQVGVCLPNTYEMVINGRHVFFLERPNGNWGYMAEGGELVGGFEMAHEAEMAAFRRFTDSGPATP